MKYTNATQVPRNDFQAALEYYEANKPLRPDEYDILVHSQDDPGAFVARTEDWEIMNLSPFEEIIGRPL